jgi:hypothetical protein
MTGYLEVIAYFLFGDYLRARSRTDEAPIAMK